MKNNEKRTQVSYTEEQKRNVTQAYVSTGVFCKYFLYEGGCLFTSSIMLLMDSPMEHEYLISSRRFSALFPSSFNFV